MIHWLIESLSPIHWVIDSFNHPVSDSSVQCLVDSLIHWILADSLGSLIDWYFDSLNRSCLALIYCFSISLNHRCIDSLIHSWIHWFIDSLIHRFIGSLVHCSLIRCWFVGSLLGCFIDVLTGWFIHAWVNYCSLARWFIGSFGQLCTDSVMSISLASQQPTMCSCVDTLHNLNNSLIASGTSNWFLIALSLCRNFRSIAIYK